MFIIHFCKKACKKIALITYLDLGSLCGNVVSQIDIFWLSLHYYCFTINIYIQETDICFHFQHFLQVKFYSIYISHFVLFFLCQKVLTGYFIHTTINYNEDVNCFLRNRKMKKTMIRDNFVNISVFIFWSSSIFMSNRIHWLLWNVVIDHFFSHVGMWQNYKKIGMWHHIMWLTWYGTDFLLNIKCVLFCFIFFKINLGPSMFTK